MAQQVSKLDEPLTYQIVVTAFPPEDNSKPPSYSADIDPKKKKKPHSPKNLSKDLFFDLKFLAHCLLAPISPAFYTLGMLIGVSKPLYDWQYRNIVPKTLEVDTNEKDFSRMSYEAKLSYAVIGLLGPVFFAAMTTKSFPTFSRTIVGYGGFSFCQELSQRFVRWINPPAKSSS